MNRQDFLRFAGMGVVASMVANYAGASVLAGGYPEVRPAVKNRKFVSSRVEAVINEVSQNLKNRELAWVFANCYPNTLDTTVDYELVNGVPDTYVITGDIDAMWLRDSSAQVWPYLECLQGDERLKSLIAGVINRQTANILLDPYANAFYKDVNKVSEWAADNTQMMPGIHERKWEIDSLCYPIRLAYGYWQRTGATDCMGADWKRAMRLVLKTFKEQQRKKDRGSYSFMRRTEFATDSVPLGGYGYPVHPVGLICSMFRPSDDATVFPFLIPSNLFAVESLKQMAELAAAVGDQSLVGSAMSLATEVAMAVEQYGIVQHPTYGRIYAYEVNGMGSCNLMDDANVPSLLSLGYLIPSMMDNEVYMNTRRFVLSESNPFFYKGRAGEGIGGPHVGVDYIWPLSVIMRGMTSDNDAEVKMCIDILLKSNAGTGYMHEAFHKDDVKKFTRKWFAWANTLFGEFVLKVYKERPHLLR